MVDTTIVYPKPGVTVYLPGGVHGFTTAHSGGIPMPSAHADPLIAAGHLDTDEMRAAAAKAQEPAPAEHAAEPEHSA